MHRIRRQVIELELPREAGAIALQRRASRVFQEEVLPQLDALFSRIAPAGRFVRIERLNIDLGSIPESRWEKAFVEACVAQIAEQVAAAAFQVGSSDTPTVRALGAAANTLEVMHYFLANGTLPWHARSMTLRELAEAFTALPTTETLAMQRLLLPLLRHHAPALQRLVWQFPVAIVHKIIAAAAGLLPDWIPAFVALHPGKSIATLPEVQKATIFAALLQAPPGGWKQEIPTIAAIRQTPLLIDLSTRIFGGLPALASDDDPDQKTPPLSATADIQPVNLLQTIPEASVRIDRPSSKGQSNEPQAYPTANTDSPATPATAVKSPARHPDAEQGIAVADAGLVLAAVYLPFLLKGVDLLDGNNFRDEAARHRAVHLLHFVATGTEIPEEPRLILPKFLCGMAIADPIPADIALTEPEKTEANALLQAMIDNWGVLKNTSPDGLRAAFLQRSGQLTWKPQQNAWLLQIERKSQDLLLDRLPWSISVVKLPWMEGMMMVEW